MRNKARAFVAPDNHIRLIPATGSRLDELKEQLGATWDDALGAWKIPAVRTYALQIIEHLGKDAIDLDETFLRIGDDFGFPRKPLPKHVPKVFFPYQRDAVQYLLSNPHGSLLNISPGLGKTAIAIVASRAMPGPFLVVAPASLLRTWRREINLWDEKASTFLAHGVPPEPARFVITSYDTIAAHPEWFEVKNTWDVLIVDETVLVKNRATRRFKALAGGSMTRKVRGVDIGVKFRGLRNLAPHVWMLSGSPITRYADDLWTMMNLAYPKAFKSFWRFAERFCVFERNIWAKTGASIVGTQHARDLTWELGDVMLTINQEDVLDLPEYLFEVVDIVLTKRQQKTYDTMLHDFIWQLEGGRELSADNKLDQLLRLQQITSSLANVEGAGNDSAKADALLELIEANAYPMPMIVWTHWRGGARDLYDRLRRAHVNAVEVSGDDLTRIRDNKIEAFKAGDHDVLVMSLGVGKFGHTLTNARTIVRLDQTWNADDFIQSMRRVRRIGLKHRPVHVTLRAEGTADVLVEDNLAGKMPSIAKVTNADLIELLKGVGKR